MTFDPTPVTFGHFMLGKCSEQSGGGPALLFGTFGKLGPDNLDGRKPQHVEAEAQELGTAVRGRGPAPARPSARRRRRSCRAFCPVVIVRRSDDVRSYAGHVRPFHAR